MKNNHIKIHIYIIIVLFILLSIYYIRPQIENIRSDYRSIYLQRNIVKDNTHERVEFVDKSGKITIAADLGYAISITTTTEKGKLEKYYDNMGVPISRYSGYYAVFREYDKMGNNIRITYLDSDEQLFTMPDGFAIETREYDETGRVTKISYFDKYNSPTNTWSFGYGRINEYDTNGNNNRIVYVDVLGNPMTTKLGYASVNRTFYKSDSPHNGKIENEFYFDENNQPIALSMGQYGVHKEYDEYGQNSILTFLDEAGNPIVSKKGYTTIKRTFNIDGSVATEKYYDIDDQPYKLSEGQYGIKKNAGETTYLNQDGVSIFNLRNFLHNQSQIVIVIALIVVFLTTFTYKGINTLLLFLNLGAIIYLTLFYRDSVSIDIHLEPFWSYRQIFYDCEIRSEILKNIWLFIPLGTILYRLYPKARIVFVCVLLSIGIEIIQYSLGKGLCELDDVISNSLGSCIGFIIGKLTERLKIRINSWKHIHIAKRR